MLPTSKSCRAPVENVGALDPTADSGEGPGTHILHAAAWGLAGTRQRPLSTFPVFRPAAPQVLTQMGMLTAWRAHEGAVGSQSGTK